MPSYGKDSIQSPARIVILSAGALLWVWMIWEVSAQYAARNAAAAYRAGDYRGATDTEIERHCRRVDGPAFTECVVEQVRANHAEQRSEYELKAQQDAADAAFWSTIIGFATLLTTIIALWLVKRTLDATWRAVDEAAEATRAAKDAVNETRRIGEAQTRAYVMVGNFRLTGVVAGQAPRLHYQIKNVGQTPAYDLLVRVQFFWGAPDGVSVTDTKVRFPKGAYEGSKTVIGAGESYDIDLPFGEVEAQFFENAKQGSLKLGAFAVGSYRDIFRKRRLITAKKYFDSRWLDTSGCARLISCGKGNHSN